MAILDALTGNAGRQAVLQQQGMLAGVYPSLNQSNAQAHGQAADFLKTGFGNASGNLSTGYGAATGAINTGAGGALGYLGQGTQGAMGQLDAARAALTANGGASAPLTALANQYGQGAGLYADSLGINGGDGNQRAVDAFQRGPGYQAGLESGIDAITRHANAAGGLGGNSLKDTIKFGVDYSNQDYNKYLDRLSAFNPLQLQATQGAAAGNQAINQGVAGTYGAGAGLLDSSGRAQAGVATGQGNALADLARQYYGGQAGLDTAQGSALAGNALGEASDFQKLTMGTLAPYLDTYKQDAANSNAASANSLKLGMEGLKLLAGVAGGMGGVPGIGGSSFMPSSSFMNNSWGW